MHHWTRMLHACVYSQSIVRSYSEFADKEKLRSSINRKQCLFNLNESNPMFYKSCDQVLTNDNFSVYFSLLSYPLNLLSRVLSYSKWHKTSHFSHLLVFWPLLDLKHLVWGSQFITSKVTMPKLTFRRKFHWKMPYFWAFYHSKFRRKIIHFLIECVSYYFQIIKSFSF